MVKTPDQLKNIVEEYIKTTKIKYQETTSQVQQQDPKIQWQFIIGKGLAITKHESRDDRITIQYGIGISPEHKDGFKKILENEPEFINSLLEIAMLQDCSARLIAEGNETKGIGVSSYIDVEELNRPNFYKQWDRVNSLSNHLIRKIQIKINPKSKPTDTGTSTQSPYG